MVGEVNLREDALDQMSLSFEAKLIDETSELTLACLQVLLCQSGHLKKRERDEIENNCFPEAYYFASDADDSDESESAGNGTFYKIFFLYKNTIY